ncbi:pyridoxamine 5'-phosphate oxidase family protein [Actinoplanes derwentensis]|uniref:Nitroimidazol reductase NimA, pyridoxamine 5'-phosphate oxidase superfamily n=1 Tax=Actinoplanes derwentensis TaxID=113562 RepID=A0A1H2DCH3_9ACTN|nr:pyridoxamine 5'-phosphate oxidase family protein [Actinoplanes derwentensis]GID90193.1 hypothetical protein Ade03nite_91170 [Actinoplanes derwentensis]SDT80289.1 Nitroimidazol reductase NimA, pyridoxamine 5'-phosphate oxidase superfamily [Actinoplanes derwentensis]
MPPVLPDTSQVEKAITELLREEEIGSIATICADGTPSAATMHFASDGLAVYCHTFTYTRKYAALKNNPNIAYALAHTPPEGFHGRMKVRSVQVTGRATFLTEQADIEHAIDVSREQFSWLQDSNMYDNFKREGVALRQVFFRIDPVTALWADNRVHMLYRTLVTFTPDGKNVASLAPYDTKAAA